MNRMKTTKRLLAAMAAMLLSATSLMTVVGFAATGVSYTAVPISGTVGADAAKAVPEVFTYAPASITASGTHTINNFDPTKDYYELVLPAGITVSGPVFSTDSVITLTDSASKAETLVFTGVDVTGRSRPACTAALTGYTVTAGKNGFALSQGSSDTVAFTATAVWGSIEGDPVHFAATTHDKSLTAPTWSITSGDAGGLITINQTTGVLDIPGTLTPGSYSVAVQATGNGQSGTATTTFTVNGCDATLAGATLAPTGTGVSGNTLALTGTAGGSASFTLTPVFTASSCNTHGSDPTHGRTVVAGNWRIDPAPTGEVSFANGVLNVGTGATAAYGPYTITCDVTDTTKGGTVQNISTTLSVVRSGGSCSATPTITWGTLPGTTGHLGGSQASASYTFKANLGIATPGSCTDPTHANDPTHGKKVTWNVTSAAGIAGVASGAQDSTYVLTATKAAMQPSSTVTITATVAGGNTLTHTMTLTRDAACNKVITSMPAVQTNGNSNSTVNTDSQNRLVMIPTSDTAATVNFRINGTPSTTGSCEYDSPGVTGTCPKAANHTPTWSLDKSHGSAISINATTGVLTVNRRQLSARETRIQVIAKANGKSSTGYLVVQHPSYVYEDDRTEAEKESERNEAQWNRLEDDIDWAEKGESVRVSLGSNTKMPTYITRDLVGQNVNLELGVGGGFTWYINGKDVKAPPSYQITMNLGIKSISDKTASRLAKNKDIEILELAHDGSFYGTYYLGKRLGSSYAGKYVYLYKLNDDADKLTFKTSVKVDSDGYVKLPFTSASTYVLTDSALYGEKPGATTGSSSSSSGGASASVGGGNGGGTVTPKPPASSVAPLPPASSASSSSSSSSESSSSSTPESSEPESSESSSSEVSRPTDVEPEEPQQPEKPKAKIPIIVPILLVVVTLTVIAVVLLARGGRNVGE